MVKTRQGWVLLICLKMLAAEAVGGATSAVGGVRSAGKSWMLMAAATSMSVLASETEVAASAAVSMASAVLEVVYRAEADVTSSVETAGAPKVATWPMAEGTWWGRSWVWWQAP
eukprot:g16853.t1